MKILFSIYFYALIGVAIGGIAYELLDGGGTVRPPRIDSFRSHTFQDKLPPDCIIVSMVDEAGDIVANEVMRCDI